MASLRTFMKKQIGQIISICPEKKDFPVREDVMFDYYAATNYGITELVYGSVPGSGGRNENIEYNCKQAVIVNQDWIEPELNKDYADWADHYGTAILPAKVRKPKFKSSVENAVGILEKGFFHKLEERQYFSLEQFNKDLWNELKALNKEPFKKKNITDTIIGRKRNLN